LNGKVNICAVSFSHSSKAERNPWPRTNRAPQCYRELDSLQVRKNIAQVYPRCLRSIPPDEASLDRCNLGVQCHTPAMTRYVITPRGKTYWIERIDVDGQRTQIERWATEREAVVRQASFQVQADVAEERIARFTGYATARPY